MEAIEEIREAVWQKNKPEEMALIKEIEEAQRILIQLQQKYRDFEARVTQEVELASNSVKESEPIIKIKVKKGKK
jgi:serine phosphatase RsbU (regulator of sigma subunit)